MFAVEKFQILGQHQVQSAGDNLEAGAGQHAGHGGRHRVGDAHHHAEQAGALRSRLAGQPQQGLADALVLEAHVAHGQHLGEEGAAGVVDADHRAVGDKIDALLAAIVRVTAPADVGQVAGDLPEPALLGGLDDADGLEKLPAEADEIAGVRR